MISWDEGEVWLLTETYNFLPILSTLLRWKNKRNSTWINLTYSPIKKNYLLILSWFHSTKRFKIMHSNTSYLSKLKFHLKNNNCQKYAKRSSIFFPFSLFHRTLLKVSSHEATLFNTLIYNVVNIFLLKKFRAFQEIFPL